MNIEIINGKNEFENNNYEKALEHLNHVDNDDENYELVLLLKAVCYKRLKEYRTSLKIYDDLISQKPYNAYLWLEKASCHVFLDEKDKAKKAMGEVDRVVDKTDKTFLIDVSRAYSLIGDYDNALKYCDCALGIDGEYDTALYEKLIILSRIDDGDAAEDVCNKIIELKRGDLLGLMPVFLHNLFSKKYGNCVNIMRGIDDDEFDDEYIELLKGVIYNNMCDDLNVRLILVNASDMSVDDALDAMLGLVETGKDEGVINGVQYFII